MGTDPRGLFCNRTLNLRSIRAIGYDMDYTLIHYAMEVWERHAYEYIKTGLAELGWPVEGLEFAPDLVVRGLIIDRELGNVVKANRFGYVKRAFHGTTPMEFDLQRKTYARTIVELREGRWSFLNTLFSISESVMFMQLVDRVDRGELPGVSYPELYARIRDVLDRAHAEGRLKQEVLADPDRFVELDPELPRALLDQKEAGKMIMLITNSEWSYAAPLMAYAFDRFMPKGLAWTDAFDLIITGARKPEFFSAAMPTFRVVSDDGLLREHSGPLERGGRYVGANADLIERSFKLDGEDILYVGDHVFADVNVSKNIQRWRTALIVRELEDELTAIGRFAEDERRLERSMDEKIVLERRQAELRLSLQRIQRGHEDRSQEEVEKKLAAVKSELMALDEQIVPLAKASAELHNPRWGLLLRTGNDKSHLARQVERYADIYTSRVSNFLHHTPFAYLRSARGNLPHD